jgi:hypothetical protein
MTEYDPSQFHPRNLRCVLSLDNKQAQAVCVHYSLPGKTKVEQHLAIVDHFFETPTLKSEKNQKAQNDNEDKLNTLLERAQKKIEAQIAQSQQIFKHQQISRMYHSSPTVSPYCQSWQWGYKTTCWGGGGGVRGKVGGGGGGVRGKVGGRCEEDGQIDG